MKNGFLQNLLARMSYRSLSIVAGISAFSAYTCMYAFRKAFTAATFSHAAFFGVDYKVLLVIAQVIGYMLSKFYGIKYIGALDPAKRGRSVLLLIGIAWVALLGFALTPAPYNIIFLLINGFPLGMIWGLVFGYLEGRKSTEFTAAVLSVSLIFASGFVKTIGRTLIESFAISEYWMPFATGLCFVPFLLISVWVLENVPPPTDDDKRFRIERKPMSAPERAAFLKRFLPGLILSVFTYVLLTIMRDLRDNFEVEIWAYLGISDKHIYSANDTVISLLVLMAISLLVLVRNNLRAFSIIHFFILSGCAMIIISTWLFNLSVIGPVVWMGACGLGLYLGYIPYNAVFFERLIATFRYKSNVGFIMYVSDSAGYLGSVSVLLFKEFSHSEQNWGEFFKTTAWIVAILGGLGALLSLIYFRAQAFRRSEKDRPEVLQLTST
ncbi:MAG: hypothetical protein INR69_07975 [Mucilaginibacter polytrichastri]|nr:hypothetical protein [Mucilaginibacter polytrichastri]